MPTQGNQIHPSRSELRVCPWYRAFAKGTQQNCQASQLDASLQEKRNNLREIGGIQLAQENMTLWCQQIAEKPWEEDSYRIKGAVLRSNSYHVRIAFRPWFKQTNYEKTLLRQAANNHPLFRNIQGKKLSSEPQQARFFLMVIP